MPKKCFSLETHLKRRKNHLFKYLLHVHRAMHRAMNESLESPIIQAVRKRIQSWIDAGNYSEDLYLANMNITELPEDIFAGCSQCKCIQLAYNKLSELPENIFAECSQLRTVILAWNRLTTLPKNIFAKCPKLSKINLTRNRLIGLPADIFLGCPQLREIYFYENNFATLPADLFAKCSELYCIDFDNSLIYHVLWSIPDFDRTLRDYSLVLTTALHRLSARCPIESALVRRWRRIANDPLSYAWSVRRFAILGRMGK